MQTKYSKDENRMQAFGPKLARNMIPSHHRWLPLPSYLHTYLPSDARETKRIAEKKSAVNFTAFQGRSMPFSRRITTESILASVLPSSYWLGKAICVLPPLLRETDIYFVRMVAWFEHLPHQPKRPWTKDRNSDRRMKSWYLGWMSWAVNLMICRSINWIVVVKVGLFWTGMKGRERTAQRFI